MFDKTSDYWFALIGALIFVAYKDYKNRPWGELAATIGASVFLGLGLSSTAAAYFSISEAFMAAVIAVFGVVALGLVRAILSDQELIIELFKSFLKVKK